MLERAQYLEDYQDSHSRKTIKLQNSKKNKKYH